MGARLDPNNGHPAGAAPQDVLQAWVSHVMADTDTFFTPPPTTDYHFETRDDGSGRLTFPSALETPHPDNNIVRCQFFPRDER